VREAAAPVIGYIDNPPALQLSAFVEGQPYSLSGSLFNPADASRLDRLTQGPPVPTPGRLQHAASRLSRSGKTPG
jgi:hypothetical protein